MNVVVEYLILLPSNGTFCSTSTAFNQLLQVDARLSLKGKLLKFKDSDDHVDFSCDYEIIGGDVQGKQQRFFQITFTGQVSDDIPEDDLERFAALLRAVRGIIAKAHENKANSTPEILWDDISAYYAQKAYPLLRDIENLLRKLIANFMLVTVGKEWVSDTSPKDFTDTLNKSKRKAGGFNNQLQTVDFIDLADFLLKPYSPLPVEKLYDTVRKLKPGDDIAVQDLQEYLPRSNWQRYFSVLVGCKDEYLKPRWEELYDLRCKVAHNAQFERRDYKRVHELTTDLGDKFRAGVLKLPEVIVPQEEQEVVAENAAARLYPILGEFISSWQLLENAFEQHSGSGETSVRNRSLLDLANRLHKQNILDDVRYANLRALMQVRNTIVHHTGVIYSEADLECIEKVSGC